jgi:hypothetical protein
MIHVIEACLIMGIVIYFLADFYFEYKLGVTTVASSKRAVKSILDFIPEDFNGKVVDLGSAWGGLVMDVARARPKAEVTGIEFSLFPYLVSAFRLKISGIGNLKVLREDFFKYTLNDTHIVVCYLPDPMMKHLSEKFRSELPAGARIISHDYPIPDWKPDTEITFTDLFIKVTMFVYEIKKPI